jgi:hypothetical protein
MSLLGARSGMPQFKVIRLGVRLTEGGLVIAHLHCAVWLDREMPKGVVKYSFQCCCGGVFRGNQIMRAHHGLRDMDQVTMDSTF